MEQWEYRVVDVRSGQYRSATLALREDHLDDLGAQGWELCGTISYRVWNTAHKMIFKRRVMDD